MIKPNLDSMFWSWFANIIHNKVLIHLVPKVLEPNSYENIMDLTYSIRVSHPSHICHPKISTLIFLNPRSHIQLLCSFNFHICHWFLSSFIFPTPHNPTNINIDIVKKERVLDLLLHLGQRFGLPAFTNHSGISDEICFLD